MTLRDLLLVVGTLPLITAVAFRLAAEMGLVREAPPPEAMPAALVVFGVVFLLYVALTLRAIARATRAILARDAQASPAETVRPAAVSDFAIHLDRSAEVDLRDGAAAGEDDAGAAAEPPRAARSALLGEVSSLLTRIPSARSR